MNTPVKLTLAALALCSASVCPTALRAQENDQITVVSRTPIADAAQITFGYLCDNRFVLRNDGTQSIDLQYGLEKGTALTSVTLDARESLELSSPSKEPVQLWMGGKLIATALKEDRSCKDVQWNPNATVVPPETASTASRSEPMMYAPPYPFYDPWGFYYGYGAFGFRPYYGMGMRFPLIISGEEHHEGGRRGR